MKSSYCDANGCVEVRFAGSIVYVQDSTDPYPSLVFTAAEWDAFVLGVKNNEFDLPAALPDPSTLLALAGAVVANPEINWAE